MEDWQAAGFGLYIHWPFCQSKCPYCDFNSHVSATIDQGQWRDAYLREIRRVGAMTENRTLRTIYFGGGTPSLMPPATVDSIIAVVRDTWPMVNDPEITLEANPTSVEAGRLHAFRTAGINRVSLGVQAMNTDDLRRLGRMHSADDALRAVELAATIFPRYSFDLIYARQHQTLAEWEAELLRALSLGSDHLSVYQLTVEDGTVFGQRHKLGQLRGLPDEDLGADFYDLTQHICESAGMPAYETSNHARPGSESQHNMIYWKSGDFAGIGPGAHGRLTLGGKRQAFAAPRDPAFWLQAASAGTMKDYDSTLDRQDMATEFLLMGLRLREGLSLSRFKAHCGLEPPKEAIDDLIGLEMIEQSGDQLRATAKGRPLLNAILLKLVAAL